MKYTIFGFSQKNAIKHKLDLTDLLILRYITDFYSSMTKEIVNKKEYGWISYNSLLKNIPILPTKNKASLFKRIKKLEKKDFIERVCIKNKKGSFSYVRLTDKMGVLVSNRGMDEKRDPRMDENKDPRMDEKRDQTNSSIKINSSIKKEREDFLFFKKIIKRYKETQKIKDETIEKLYPSLKAKFKKCLKTLGSEEEMEKQIENYLNYILIENYRAKADFEVWINQPAKYLKDWIEKKNEFLARQKAYNDKNPKKLTEKEKLIKKYGGNN